MSHPRAADSPLDAVTRSVGLIGMGRAAEVPGKDGAAAIPGRGGTDMSAGGNRRELRRRLLQAAPADSARLPQSPTASGGRSAAYASEALPERHPSFAARIPSGRLSLWGISAAAIALNAVVAIVVMEARPGRSLDLRVRLSTERAGFDRTAVIVAEAFRSPAAPGVPTTAAPSGLPQLKLPDWMGQTSLLAAAAIAVALRQMRRHRLDDFQGHYRAWGWLTGLVILTAIARQLPLGLAVGAFASDAVGREFGPSGLGWWLLACTVAWLGVVAWCLVPLEHRLASTGWFVVAWAAWLAGAAIDACIRSGRPTMEWLGLAGSLAITAGDTALLVAMLWTFRTVLREVRGELPVVPGGRRGEGGRARPIGSSPRPDRHAVEEDRSVSPHGAAERIDSGAVAASMAPGIESGGGLEHAGGEGSRQAAWNDDDANDGSEDGPGDPAGGMGGRKLSKAERRRLRKQARLDRAA